MKHSTVSSSNKWKITLNLSLTLLLQLCFPASLIKKLYYIIKNVQINFHIFDYMLSFCGWETIIICCEIYSVVILYSYYISWIMREVLEWRTAGEPWWQEKCTQWWAYRLVPQLPKDEELVIAHCISLLVQKKWGEDVVYAPPVLKCNKYLSACRNGG